MKAKTKTTTKKPVIKVLAWRNTNRLDWLGEPISEALIEGHGWCQYYWRHSYFVIDDKWVTY